MRYLNHLVVVASLLVAPLASGCGYSLAGRGSFLPEYIKNIGVPPFTNGTPVFDIDRRVTDHVRSELSGRGKYKVFPVEAGNDAVLTGEITSITVVMLDCRARSSAGLKSAGFSMRMPSQPQARAIAA